MKTKSFRVFRPNVPLHVYQRAADKGVIFYKDIDILLHLSIFGTYAKQYEVTVMAMSYMVDHIHSLAVSCSKQHFESLYANSQATFAIIYNRFRGRKGILFDRPFQFSPKKTAKDVRSCINYIHNNGTEKKICRRCVDYKWNFLQYATGVSRGDAMETSSGDDKLKHWLQLLSERTHRGKYLDYNFLCAAKSQLSKNNWKVLVNSIIVSYLPVDFNAAARYFDGISDMIAAPDSNTGSEYDIKEEFGGKTHVSYYRMSSLVKDDFSPFKIDKLGTLNKLVRSVEASTLQLSSFLHIDYSIAAEFLRNRNIYPESLGFSEQWLPAEKVELL